MYYKNERDMKLVKDIDKTSSKKPEVNDKQAEDAFKTILTWIGEDPNREGLLETPKRVVKAFKEYFKGYHQDPSAELMKTFGDAKVIGPLLIGLNLPVEIAPLRSSTSEIINLASIAAYSSEIIDYKK